LQHRGEAVHLDRRSRQNHRRSQMRVPNVRLDSLVINRVSLASRVGRGV